MWEVLWQKTQRRINKIKPFTQTRTWHCESVADDNWWLVYVRGWWIMKKIELRHIWPQSDISLVLSKYVGTLNS